MTVDDIVSQLRELLQAATEGFVNALPNVIMALTVVLVGWVVASALRRLIQGFFRRIPIRAQDQRTASFAAGGVFWLVMAGAAVLAVDALRVPTLTRWVDAVAAYLPRLALAAALVLGGAVLGRLASIAIVRADLGMPASQSRRLGRLAHILIVSAAALIAPAQVGLDVSLLASFVLIAWAVLLGAGGLAFGLGSKDVMSDILAMHYVNKSFRVGQLVSLGDARGRIVRTTRTSVYLDSAEGELSIPGRDFAGSRCLIVSEEESRGA